MKKLNWILITISFCSAVKFWLHWFSNDPDFGDSWQATMAQVGFIATLSTLVFLGLIYFKLAFKGYST